MTFYRILVISFLLLPVTLKAQSSYCDSWIDTFNNSYSSAIKTYNSTLGKHLRANEVYDGMAEDIIQGNDVSTRVENLYSEYKNVVGRYTEALNGLLRAKRLCDTNLKRHCTDKVKLSKLNHFVRSINENVDKLTYNKELASDKMSTLKEMIDRS